MPSLAPRKDPEWDVLFTLASSAIHARGHKVEHSEGFEAIRGLIKGSRCVKDVLLLCSLHPMGGTAYLSLESPDEPFLHGIKFTAMPPTKRFRDMEQLSGGEKVMSRLTTSSALLCPVEASWL